MEKSLLQESSALRFGEFVGTSRKRKEVSGFSLGFWHAQTPEPDPEPHGHSHGHFMFVINGRLRTRAHGNDVVRTPRLLFHPSETFHNDHFESPHNTFFTVSVASNAMESVSKRSVPQTSITIEDPNVVLIVLKMLHELLRHDGDSPLQTESNCFDLIGTLEKNASEESSRPKWLGSAEGYIRENYHEKITLEQLSSLAQIHPVHLIRTFKRFHRCTPGDYLRRWRVTCAAKFLATSTLATAEIAVMTGFSDQSHLIRNFKAVLGTTPEIFKKELC